MKKILFAMAALATLASCQKAEIAEQNSVNTNGERVITAYFDNAQTKTTLDDNGFTPKWTVGDKIMVLDGSGHQEITLDADDISSDGKSVTITVTELSGTLYAVYPSDAADAERIVTENIVPVNLEAEQDGTFGSANICVAKENDGSLAFKNVTSVLHLTQTASTGVNEIIITTPSADIAGTGTVDMSAATPALTFNSPQSKKIKVKSESVKTHYYIAVAPTTLPAGTAFGFATGSELGGTNLSEEKTIAANTIYNIGSMDESELGSNKYHEYVEIGGLKWATMNVGATSATEAGTYFAWGDVVGQTWIPLTSGVAAHWSGSGFDTAPTLDPANPSVLPLSYDAANVNWGGSWRMPTGGTNEGDDFIALFRACGIASGYQCTPTTFDGTGTENEGVYWCDDYDDSGVKGTLFITEGNRTHLFFPAAGHGDGAGLVETDSTGHSGYYLSSTNTSAATKAYCLYIGQGSKKVEAGGNLKYYGWSVRPVSD